MVSRKRKPSGFRSNKGTNTVQPSKVVKLTTFKTAVDGVMASNIENTEPTQLTNVQNYQSPVNLMEEKISYSPDFAPQHVSQIPQQLFATSQQDQIELQQQYYYLQMNNACYQMPTPGSQVDGASSFYFQTESFKQDDFSPNAFTIQQSPTVVPDGNTDLMYYSQETTPQPFEDLVYINQQVEKNQRTTQQMQSPPISLHSMESEHLSEISTVYHTDGYLTPPPPLDTTEREIFSPSKGVKKAPKTSSRTFKTFNEKYNSQPGPIRASPPVITFDEATGKEFLVFSYSNKKVITKFSLYCPQIDFFTPINLDEEFLRDNCIYPGAMCSPEEYSGKRGNYERECNIIGWKLAEYNSEIRGRRGLIQRAVDSWRNTRKDLKIRSRRVRKEHKMKKRKELESV